MTHHKPLCFWTIICISVASSQSSTLAWLFSDLSVIYRHVKIWWCTQIGLHWAFRVDFVWSGLWTVDTLLLLLVIHHQVACDAFKEGRLLGAHWAGGGVAWQKVEIRAIWALMHLYLAPTHNYIQIRISNSIHTLTQGRSKYSGIPVSIKSKYDFF